MKKTKLIITSFFHFDMKPDMNDLWLSKKNLYLCI